MVIPAKASYHAEVLAESMTDLVRGGKRGTGWVGGMGTGMVICGLQRESRR
jgi:hypothetical protein